jgi:hypothetical protein
MTSAEAYAAYLAAIEAERVAIGVMYTVDDAYPFDQAAFDAANENYQEALRTKAATYRDWYAALGNEHAQQVSP